MNVDLFCPKCGTRLDKVENEMFKFKCSRCGSLWYIWVIRPMGEIILMARGDIWNG